MPSSINRHHHSHAPPPPKTNTNPRKLLFFLLKCIIMACILSLFLLFLGFAAIVLLHFLLITTAFRNRRGSTSTTATTTTATMRVLQDSLPHEIYRTQQSSAQSICAICLDCFREGDSSRRLPACGHLFHMNCIDSWLAKVPNCPICRSVVQLGSRLSPPFMSDDDWKIWWAIGG